MTSMRFAAAALAALIIGLASAAGADCRERQRLDEILNISPAVWQPSSVEPADPVMRMYDIIGPWAVAVAIGDYAGAEALADGILPRMEQLFDAVDAAADPTRAESGYARTLISGTIARIALVDHRFLRALRYGLIARDAARSMSVRHPHDPRPGFFLGLYSYYTGLAPRWVRAVGSLAGLDGNLERGLALLEDAARSGQPLAPEAARVLLEETAPKDRPVCRYLPLARDLAARYPDNFRFRFYVEREQERCAESGVAGIDDPPRLAGACGRPAHDSAAH